MNFRIYRLRNGLTRHRKMNAINLIKTREDKQKKKKLDYIPCYPYSKYEIPLINI